MSISIGIGLQGQCSETLIARFKDIARSFSYGLESGIASFETDVREGVQIINDFQSWNHVFSLRAPYDAKANLAFDVHEELSRIELAGEEPKFFGFIRSIVKEAKLAGMIKLGVFFASEWYAKDRIRMNYGDIERFIAILSLPGHWTVRVLNPSTGRMEDWDDIPYFYELEITENVRGQSSACNL